MKQLLALAVLAVLVAGCGKKDVKNYTVPGLTESLKDSDPGVRYTAAYTLGTYGPEARTAAPALTEAIKDPDKNVRIGVVYALAEIGPDARIAVPALQEALNDQDPQVREGAAYALRRIQTAK
jgi:HEAT repeat protein